MTRWFNINSVVFTIRRSGENRNPTGETVDSGFRRNDEGATINPLGGINGKSQ